MLAGRQADLIVVGREPTGLLEYRREVGLGDVGRSLIVHVTSSFPESLNLPGGFFTAPPPAATSLHLALCPRRRAVMPVTKANTDVAQRSSLRAAKEIAEPTGQGDSGTRSRASLFRPARQAVPQKRRWASDAYNCWGLL